MDFYVVPRESLTSIADAIRTRSGLTRELIFPIEFIEIIETLAQDYTMWDGDYIITPAILAQSLNTKGKIMRDNVTINAIPYNEVSNNAGGNTARIGF